MSTKTERVASDIVDKKFSTIQKQVRQITVIAD